MSGVDLKLSLVATLRDLLNSKDNIENQLNEAKNVLKRSFEENAEGNMSPISIEKDAVWLNYLIELLKETNNNISLVENALSQLDSSGKENFVSELNMVNNFRESQGSNTLDFSVERER